MLVRFFLLFAIISSLPTHADQPFTDLFNGKDLSGWDTWLGAAEVPALPIKLWGEWPETIGLNRDSEAVFSVVEEDGEPAIRVSGEIWGALISKQSYGNYHLQIQYKWGETRTAPRADKPRNTGLLYHSLGDYGAFWTYWMRSAEFEIMEGHTGDFTSVDGVAGDTKSVRDWSESYPWKRYETTGSATRVGGLNFRLAAKNNEELKHGQWNTLDLYTVGANASHVVNGRHVFSIENLRDDATDPPTILTKGRLQLQSEGAEVFFRRLRIRPIEEIPEEARG